MVASFVVSLTAIPVFCSFLLIPRQGESSRNGRFVAGLKSVLKHTLLRFGLGSRDCYLGLSGW